MLIILRNLFVNIIAVFIRDRNVRHRFRNKYKKKSKYRKLRDDNIRLFNENKSIKQEINNLKAHDLNEIKNQLYKINSSLFSISNTYTDDPWVYLSIACQALNEGPYLKEWIEYHRLVGVQRFYFYDNGSDDDTTEILEPYIRDGIVIYYKAFGYGAQTQGMQTSIYNDAVCKYRYQTYWLALIDLDEFLLPIEKDNIVEILKDYEGYPAVALNWLCFDTNGHKTKPTEHGGLVTANYTRVSKEYDIKVNKHIKSIVNPRKVAYVPSVHYAVYNKSLYFKDYCVTETFEPVHGPFTKHHSSSKIRINHYFTKSEEEYLKRHNMHPGRNRLAEHSKGWLVDQDFKETTEDTSIQKFLPKLKAAMNITD